MTITLQPVSGTGATGTVEAYIHDVSVYSRYITDVETALGLNTYPIPDDDLVENNRNYHYAIGYQFPETIAFYDGLTTTPTKWGLYQPGQYYAEPYSLFVGEWFPVARAVWGRVSIWFAFWAFDIIAEQSWRKEYTLKDAFPLWSVISVLLAKIAPGITHAGTTDYSRFLYDINPISYIDQRLFITPKSNLIASGYDQPAQKAQITLKRVTDMLRDCFRCYWFIDEQNRFRVEHISWFMRGGSYSGTPVVGMDLTKQIVTRNGKPWSYVRNQYQFDKPNMAARYQFGWMDDVTELFDGYPIDIISKYVNPDNIEQIDVSQFTSDVDYILLNPSDIFKDGFVLLGATKNENIYQNSWLYNDTLVDSVGNVYIGTVTGWKAIRIPVTPGASYSIGGFRLGRLGYYGFYNNDTLVSFNRFGDPDGGEIGPIIIPSGVNYLWVDVVSPLSPENPIANLFVRDNSYKLPYVNFEINNSDHLLQNAWVSFVFLQMYYMFDMPAWNVEINGVRQYVQGIKKLKTQTLKFPMLREPDMFNLIKTGLGNGTIQKMSVNLSSRNANTTLKYDTE